MAAAHFHLVRHMPPAAEAYARAYGRGIVPLDADAPDVLDRMDVLRGVLPAFAQWRVSSIPRALETAQRILSGSVLTPAAYDTDAAFDEQDFGIFADRLFTDLRADPVFQRYAADPITMTPPEGESFTDCFNRVGAQLKALSVIPGEHVIVTHGGVVRSGVGLALGLTPLMALKGIAISPLMHAHIVCDDGRWQLHGLSQGCAKRQHG